VKKIEDELFSDYSSKAFKAGLTVKKKDQDTRKGQRRNFGFSREANSFGGVGRSFVERSQFAGYVNSCESRSPFVPPLSPVRPPIMERSEGNDSGTENKTVLS